MIDFFFDGNPPNEWHGVPPGHVNITATRKGRRHVTTKQADTFAQYLKDELLVDFIQDIDEEYYNGDIAWLHSQLPCRGKNKKLRHHH